MSGALRPTFRRCDDAIAVVISPIGKSHYEVGKKKPALGGLDREDW
jgi:hypothetical protein